MTLRLFIAAAALSIACSPAAAQKAPVNADAAALEDFGKRIDAYMKVHSEAKGDGPRLKESEHAGEIKAAQETLAANIRKLRANAKAGDIFTPAIRARFRALMYPELRGEDGRDARAVLKDDAPRTSAVVMKVNAPYVADTKATTPSNLLANLPMLPEELQYRVVGRHLVLIDVDANLIVDFVPNAIR
jgi:hypothetical protein